MLRFLAFSPLLAAGGGAPRALADGSSGTLGAGVVGSYELRRGAVTLDRIADLEPGRILGRGAESGPGAPEALDIQGLRSLLRADECEMIGLTSLALEQMRPEAGTLALRSLGVYAPGDGGHALWRAAVAEPQHPGKLRTADGRWWELDPEQMISPRMFGALGDGQFNDTPAFDAGVAYCRHMRVPLRIPAGTFVLDSLSAIIRDVTGGPTVPRDEVIIRGAGRTATHLVFSKDLTAPFLKCAPSQNAKLGAVELTDLTIDGRGFAGTAIKLSHMSKCHFARLRITDVRGMAFDCAELWDSMFHDVLIEGVGDYAAALPSLRLRDRDLSDANSSCNNLGFYDLHIENHPFRGLEILDTSRKLTFVRLKCHHTPGNFPPLGTDHVVLDSRGIASGGGYMITFLGIHLAVSLLQGPGGLEILHVLDGVEERFHMEGVRHLHRIAQRDDEPRVGPVVEDPLQRHLRLQVDRGGVERPGRAPRVGRRIEAVVIRLLAQLHLAHAHAAAPVGRPPAGLLGHGHEHLRMLGQEGGERGGPAFRRAEQEQVRLHATPPGGTGKPGAATRVRLRD